MATFLNTGKEIIYKPSTQEIFRCLSCMPKWSHILLKYNSGKLYQPFLKWLLEVNYFNDIDERITIKRIATTSQYEVTKVTKWLHEIYEDIFEINDENPELFLDNVGISVNLYMKSYYNVCSFNVTVPVIPRTFEDFEFPFVEAEMGTSHFWVKDVKYLLNNDKLNVSIWLVNGTMNRYREFALDKALFHNRIHFMDVFHKKDFEIDKELKRLDK